MAAANTTTYFPHRRSLLGLLAAPVLVSAPRAAHAARPSAMERAQHHFSEFAKAMNEVAAQHAGWCVEANFRPSAGSWSNVRLIRLEPMGNKASPAVMVERHEGVEGFKL